MLFGIGKRLLVGRPMQSDRLGHTLLPKRIALLVVAVIAVMNLRGVRESGTAFAIPTYCFVGVVLLMIIWGGIRLATGAHLHAETAGYPVKVTGAFAGLALVFLVLRAFSSGCTALTGVEAI